MNETDNISDTFDFVYDGWYFDAQNRFTFSILKASQTEIWLVSVFTMLFALIGLCLYLRVCYILIKFKKSTFSNAFYVVVLYLAVPDCIYLFVQVVFGFLITVIGFFNVPLMMVLVTGYIGEICSYSLFGLISLMGINRYIAICHFEKYNTWFERKRVHIGCWLCFLLGFLLPAVDNSCQCFSFKSDFSWKYACKWSDEGYSDPPCMNEYATLFDEIVWTFFTLLIPLINFATLIRYFVKKHKLGNALSVQSNWKKDVSLLFQFVSISLVFALYMIFFWIEDQTGISNNMFDAIITLLSILNSSVNPYLYITFSTDIRSKMWNSNKSVSTSGTTRTQSTSVSIQKPRTMSIVSRLSENEIVQPRVSKDKRVSLEIRNDHVTIDIA